MKSALFVDFDNVFSGLRRLDSAVADRFAVQPLAWIQWLAEQLPAPPHAPSTGLRRLLVRRCYLNPQVYQRFRPSFNRAGFEIIDCPAMTSEGKTSTDIHMVLDIVDLLQHEAHYDEFIVFSADADFTPVLRKLRRWDRRTTVLAIGFPSAAYQASADLLIDQDEFVRDGLGFGDTEVPVPPIVEPTAAPSDAEAEAHRLANWIRDEVRRTARPLACARLAQVVSERHARLAADWGGKGSFRKFVETLELEPLRVDWQLAGGQVYDPGLLRMDAPRALDWGDQRRYLPLIGQVRAAIGLPMLSPREFVVLIDALAADVAVQPFQLSETGKRVRDRCRKAGEAVSRGDVSFVLKGVALGGHEFGRGDDRTEVMASRFVESALALCKREQLMLDDSQMAMLRQWAAGG